MFLKIFAILIVVSAIIYIGTCTYIATKLTKPVPSPITEDPATVSRNYTNVSFVTSDHFNLKGWLFKNENSKKIVIFVQGVNNNRADTPYGTLQIASQLYQKGFSVLLFDIRATGESDGKIISFGLESTKDVQAAVDFAVSQGYEKKDIGILSNSLGAIAVIMDLENLQDMGAIVLDSSAARVKPIVEGILSREQHIPTFLFPGIFTSARLLYGVNLDVINPIEKISLAQDKELLFLHGEKDVVIPVENSRELVKKLNNGSKLIVFANAEHTQSFKSNPDLYMEEVLGYFSRKLK